MDPNDERARQNLGNIYYSLKNYAEAKRLYKKALELYPNDKNVWYGLGITYSALTNYPEAGLGNIYHNLQYYPEAERCYKKVLELDPNDKGALNLLGNVLEVKKGKIFEKIRKIMKVSTKIRLDIMRDVLKMEFSEFNEKIFDWAVEFGFKIDGDYIIIENSDVEGFINQLDAQFEIWENREK